MKEFPNSAMEDSTTPINGMGVIENEENLFLKAVLTHPSCNSNFIAQKRNPNI